MKKVKKSFRKLALKTAKSAKIPALPIRKRKFPKAVDGQADKEFDEELAGKNLVLAQFLGWEISAFWGSFGGSKSHLRQLSNGSVAVLPMKRRDFARISSKRRCWGASKFDFFTFEKKPLAAGNSSDCRWKKRCQKAR